MRVVEELNLALHDLMGMHAGLHVIGEDVLDPYGGAFKVTKGLSSTYPERVLTMPISEAGLVGFGMGMSMRGKPVIAEVMFGDFLGLAFDQIVNHAAKVSWMFNAAVEVPLIVRAPMGAGRGYGPTHSQSLEKHFCGVPGLTVFAVNQFKSPGALLKTAFELRSPVVFIENKIAYAKPVELDRIVVHSACDLAIFTYGGMAEMCVALADFLMDQEEIVANVHLVEQLHPMDEGALISALGPCRNVLIVEEGAPGWGFGAECARVLLESRPGPIRLRTVSTDASPIPNGREWEMKMLPNLQRLTDAALSLIAS